MEKNIGFGRSCNYGVSKANSKYILFLNPDTELRKNSLKTLISHMIDRGAQVSGGLAVNDHNKPHGSVVRTPNIWIGLFEFSNLGKILRINKAHDYFYYKEINILSSEKDHTVDVVGGAYLLTTSETFSKLGGFDENFFMYLEDVDLCVRARASGFKVIFCPHSKIWHEGGASSKNKYKIRHQAWFDSRKYYFKKHFGVLTNLIVQPLYNIEEWLLKTLKKI